MLARAEELRTHKESEPASVRAVLVHRNSWLVDKVATCLTTDGVRLAGAFDDGADGAGTVIAEQPDVVLVEDRLPTMTGIEVVEHVRTFAPDTLVAVQVSDSGEIRAFLEAGAQAVFSRRIRPLHIAEQLLLCLAQDEPVVLR